METVMTGGCFNQLHSGHIRLLKEAKKLGRLVVVLASDRHNMKANARPAEERKRSVLALGIADEVVIGDDNDYMKVVEKYKPDIIVLGYDQSMPKGIKTKAKIIRMPEYEAKDKIK